MEYTTNYLFKKSTYDDPSSIIDFMSNFDAIDTFLKVINDTLPQKAEHTAMVTNPNLNTLTEDKMYICVGTLSNAPTPNNYCFVRVYSTTGTARHLQVCYVPQTDHTMRMFMRGISVSVNGTTVGQWREIATTKLLDDTVETLQMLIEENTFRNTALAGALTKSLTTLVIQTFTDIVVAVDDTKGDGAAAIENYYKEDQHIFDKTDTGTVVIYSLAKIVSSGNNNAWAIADWQNVDGGSVELAISRNNGTTYTVLADDALTSISTQTTGVSMILRITMTGKLKLKNVAWGCKA